MGDRATIIVTTGSPYNTPVTLYGQYAGTTNLEAVRNVLARPEARIGDFAFLTAQLFHEFAVKLGNYDGGTGYGISAGVDEVIWVDNPVVTVNSDNGEYCLEGEESQTEFIRQEKVVF
jgi:hypothetical protein